MNFLHFEKICSLGKGSLRTHEKNRYMLFDSLLFIYEARYSDLTGKDSVGATLSYIDVGHY
jgi:hypothetical protein